MPDFKLFTYKGKPAQTFRDRTYILHPGERYFKCGKRYMHHDVWEYTHGKRLVMYHIHHRDNNPWNNRPRNLKQVLGFDHLSAHGKERVDTDSFKRFHDSGIEAAKVWHASSEGRQWHSKHAIDSWKGKEFSKLICQQCGNEYETRHSGISKFCHPNCKAKALRARRRLIK